MGKHSKQELASQSKKAKKKQLWHIPYRKPPCKGCPALDGGICHCAKKKLKG